MTIPTQHLFVNQIQQTNPDPGKTSRTWTMTVGTVSQISLAVELNETGGKARVYHHMRGKAHGTPIFWEIDLRLRPTVDFHSSHRKVPSFLLEPALEAADTLDPVLQEGLDLTLHWMGTRSNKKRLLEPPLKEALLRLQGHLRGLLVTPALEAARSFPRNPDNSIGWEVYQMIAGDPSGRVGQMAKICPGVILLALDLKKREPGAQRDLLGAIVSGGKRSKILDIALDLQGSRARRSPDLRYAHCAWIRNASPGVPLDCLMSLPTWPVTVEDIPSSPLENVRWYRFMHVASRAAERILDPLQRHGFLAFASRHAGELSRCLTAVDADPRQALGWLADYVHGAGRHPGRASVPASLVAESFDWHNRLAERGPGMSCLRFPADQELDPGPTRWFPTWSPGTGSAAPRPEAGEIRFLATVGDLNRESELMNHCVATHAHAAVSGAVQLFHAEIAGETATIEVTCENGSPSVTEAKGKKNQPISAKVNRAIQRWLTDLRAHVRGQTLAPSCL